VLQAPTACLPFAAGRTSSGLRPPPIPETAPALLPCRRPEITYDLPQNLRFAPLSKDDSLIAPIRSLLCCAKSPVRAKAIPCSVAGNFAVTLGICDQIRTDCRDKGSDCAKFPVFSLITGNSEPRPHVLNAGPLPILGFDDGLALAPQAAPPCPALTAPAARRRAVLRQPGHDVVEVLTKCRVQHLSHGDVRFIDARRY